MRRTRSPRRSSTMHVPSSMEQAIAADVALLVFAVVSSLDAGGSASSNIEASDRDRTVNVGNSVGPITFNLSVRSASAISVLSMCVFKCERAFAVPVIGTDPIPSSADIVGAGMQQAMRMALPGRVMHFSKIAITAETVRAVTIKVNPAKYRMSKIRPGDYIGIMCHNMSGQATTVSFEMRYKEYQ